MALTKRHREIILPNSKEKVVIRELNPYDYAFVGTIPDTFAAWHKKSQAAKAKGEKLKPAITDLKPKEVEYMAACVCRGIISGPGKWHLVAKQPIECNSKEFSFYDLPAEDSTALIEAVLKEEDEGDGKPPVDFPDAKQE